MVPNSLQVKGRYYNMFKIILGLLWLTVAAIDFIIGKEENNGWNIFLSGLLCACGSICLFA